MKNEMKTKDDVNNTLTAERNSLEEEKLKFQMENEKITATMHKIYK